MIKNIIKLMRINPLNIALFTMGSAAAYTLTQSFDLIKFILGVLIFTITYSAAYIINDLRDIEYDKKHEISWKRKRPLLTGEVSVKQARITALTLIASGLTASLLINSLFTTTITWLLILNIAYTYKIKKHINLIPYWHILNTYVKLICGWSIISESIKLIPWITLLVPSMIFAFYILIYKGGLLDKEYFNHKLILLVVFFAIVMPLSILFDKEISLKIIIAVIIALIASIIMYPHYKQKGLSSSFIKIKNLTAALILGLNLVLIS